MYELKHYLVLKLKRIHSRFLKNGACKAFNIVKYDKKSKLFLNNFSKVLFKAHVYLYISANEKRERKVFCDYNSSRQNVKKLDDLESCLSYINTIIVVFRKVLTVIPNYIVHIVGIPFNPPSLSLQIS